MIVLKVLCLIIIHIKTFSDSAKILGIVPTPSYSHQVAFQALWKELSLRGHQVTTFTTDPIDDPTLVNLTEVSLHSLYRGDRNYVQKLSESSYFGSLYTLIDASEDLSHRFLSHQQVQNLIKNNTKSYDVVIAEFMFSPTFAFAKTFNAPLVVITSVDASPHLRSKMGSPTHLVGDSDMFLPFEDNPSLYERLQLVAYKIFGEFIKLTVMIPLQQSLILKYFGPHYPPVQELTKEISLALVNSDPIFHRVKPLLPTIVQFGGGSHRTPPKPLPKELKEILDAADNGFIYFSLGSNVKSKDMSKYTLNIFMDTFAELPYTVLWKFENDSMYNKPKNVITSQWFPQQDVFKHPNIKLFITQGGLQSMDEAIYDHVPMIGIPHISDQRFNVNKMVNKGFGLSVDYRTLRKDDFKAKILEVINNPKYRNKIKELAKLALDQPMSGLEKAVWWIEYVIRHNGTKHLRSPLLDIPFYSERMIKLKVFCLLIFLESFGNCAKILGIVPTPAYSHQVVFHPIWKELSLRGHEVTTFTTDPIGDSKLVNLTEVNLECLYRKDGKHIQKMIESSSFGSLTTLINAYEDISHRFLSHQLVQNLIKNKTEKFDVVIVELSFSAMFAFAKTFNAPLVVVSSVDAPSHLRSVMGSPTHPVVYPDTFLPYEDKPSLYERLQLVAFKIFGDIFRLVVITPLQQSLIEKYFGPYYPPVQELTNKISLALVNSDPIFHRVKPLLPTIVQFGGGTHRTQPKSLPKKLKNLLDAAKNGFIYFSLGSNVKSKDLSEETLSTLIETFSELPYTVLWKFEEDDLPNKPKNLITSKWFPQQDIFKHPNIKLFITQGGLQSMDEAIYDHVPMIGIPYMCDQRFNVNKMVSKGFGLSVDYKTLRKDDLKAKILEVVNNPKYRNKIKELAELALDQPMNGIEKAVWWIDHQVVFQPIWRELSLRGHQVTTITTDIIEDATLTNLTEINLRSLYKLHDYHLEKIVGSPPYKLMFAILNVYDDMAHAFLSDQQVQNLINNKDQKFDVVMVELGLMSMYAFAKRFNAPLVVIASMDAPFALRSAMGSPTHPILYPDAIIPTDDKPSLWNRLQLACFSAFVMILKKLLIVPSQQSIVDKYFGPDYSLTELENDISLALVNSDPIFHTVTPLVPTIIQIRSSSYKNASKPLPKELKSVLDAAKNGFIYFSLGSNVRNKDISKHMLNVLIETFAEIPYTIIWKCDIEHLPNKPKNVFTAKWLPQQDIFKHPNIKLFITQGGLQSIDEAIQDHIPIIGIPFMADQYHNVHKIVKKGLGLSIDFDNLNKDEFKTKILEVIRNPMYRNKVKELAELAIDQPMTGLEKAIWWTEYVIRHNGTKHLRSPSLDIPFYQYYLLDVIAVVGHQVVFQPIWRELSLRGHQVTTITTDLIEDATLTNLTEINLRSLYKLQEYHLEKLVDSPSYKLLFAVLNFYDDLAHAFLSDQQVQNLINKQDQKFDVVMVELGLMSLYAIAKRFNAPLVVIASIDAPSGLRSAMGSPTHPIIYPDAIIPTDDKPSLWNRLQLACFSVLVTILKFLFIVPSQQSIADKYFGSDYSLTELENDISLALVNSDPIFHTVTPLVPTIIQIRSGSYKNASKPLPKELKSVLDAAENGFIYFSLGSNLKNKDISKHMLNVLIETFAEIPYTIIWKCDIEHLPNKPKNVFTAKWIPQQDIFKHPNIKLFITQGGLQSIDEAIQDRIPIIGIPLATDQYYNVHKVVKKGLGLSIDFDNLNKDEFKTKILEVIRNPMYRNKVKKLAELAMDQPMTGLEKAIWWTEYVIRHNGTKHLRCPSLDIPFYQYYLLDVIAVVTLVLIALIGAFIFIFKSLLKLIKKLTRDTVRKFLREITINGETVNAMVDTGSSICTAQATVFNKLSDPSDITATNQKIYGFGKESPAICCNSKANATIEIDGARVPGVEVFEVPNEAQPIGVLVGRSFTEDARIDDKLVFKERN
ncbi:hypothetical protein RN001_014769 [Aquatica leii]|uniref:UDP-glucuronosyltransferase n=1 Tax=Aquatica leii TaxID=1421715 RepID=A0AAN7NUW7_9COLE|nr:hypothetical protein RN001_014769 [Aquatica leii]